MRSTRKIIQATGALWALAAAALGQQANLTYKWVYIAQNLAVPANVASVQAVMQRAAAAGYNGVALADFKLQVLDSVPQSYFTNLKTVQDTAKQLGLEIYPMVFSVGYAEGILSHNPNLVEGQPVRDALFIAGSPAGQASLVADPPVAITNGGFETANGNTFPGYLFQDSPGQSTFADTTVLHSGTRSLRMENIGIVNPQSGNCRIAQTVTVSPWRQYHVSGWIKTSNFDRTGNIRIQALSPATGRGLASQDISIQPTQDWTQYHIVFNSQENTTANIYFGVWGGNTGQLWWDDCAIEELGLMNVIRRPGAPLTVRAETGGTLYQEGLDFDPVSDPRMGVIPWPGAFELYHAAPAIHLTPGSRITSGQRLRISFTHAVMTDSGKTAICLSEPASEALMKNEAERITKALRPRGYFMAHDEIRVMNWCAACQARALTPGQILADNARKCVNICNQMDPERSSRPEVFVWSDMFDPFHNAVGSYYLVNGTLSNSWEGLPPGVIIVNWNYGNRAQSLPFFSGRGHRQVLAGYYDGPVGNIRTWINDAHALNVPIAGVMYTTWANSYADLEAFAQAAWGP